MRLMKKSTENTLIIALVISFTLLTIFAISSSPNMFLGFISWLGGCESNI